MPLLAPEPDLYPDHLFDLDTRAAPWRVAYVRSRSEKALARHLYRHRIAFYLPQQHKTLLAGGRRRISRLPLFPGYVFLRGGRRELAEALRSRRIVELVRVYDQHRLHTELAKLARLQAAGFLLVPHPYIGTGDRVEIEQGLFRGYRGQVSRTRGRERLVVSITSLRRSVSVEVGRRTVRPLDRPIRPDGSEAA